MKSGLNSASSPLKRNIIMSELCGLTRGSSWNSQALLLQQHLPFCSSLWWPLTQEVLAQEAPGHLWEHPKCWTWLSLAIMRTLEDAAPRFK